MGIRSAIAVLHLAVAAAAAAAVPAPSEVLGYAPGERTAHHAELMRYAEAVAAASDRVTLERYGKSHGGRELYVAVVTSVANHARLDAIRDAIATIADPRVDGEEAAELIATTPAVAYLGYSIHGDEFSGADASLAVLQRLAEAREDVARMLDEVVVLIDPLQNPDGRERILAMNDAYIGRVANPDRAALSHTGFWPWGRGNHYLFDLNRDGFALVHPESRARAALHLRWRPQLVMDAHEMGSDSSFLLSPPRAPFNPNLPTTTRGWWDRFAADEASAFDERGWGYYTGEWFEEFFPGRGRAITPFMGAIDILHEQASTDGQSIRKADGRVVTYGGAVARQVVSTLANLTTLANNRAEFLGSYRAVRAEAMARGASGPVRAFYFAPTPHRSRAERLAGRLAAVGVEVDQIDAPVRLRRACTWWHADCDAVELPAGSFRVRLDQPHGLLARTILEPHAVMDDAFLAEERLRQERGQGTRIYDVTAWSMLLAAGLEGYWSERLDDHLWGPALADPMAGYGASLDDAASTSAGAGDAPPYVVLDGARDARVALAADLLARGWVVRLGERPVVFGDVSLPRHSFLVRREENRGRDFAELARLSAARGAGLSAAELYPAATALPDAGPSLGGGRWRLLRAPRIAIVAGAGVSPYSAGAIWHLLDREYGQRVSLIDAARLDAIDLDRYNVVVLPDTRGDAGRRIGDAGLAAVAAWVERGGSLVAVAGGAELAARAGSKLSAVRLRRDVAADFPPPQYGLAPESVRALAPMVATGLDDDASAPARARGEWPVELAIPGAGSPLLGAGTWSLLAKDVARAARDRELTPHPAKDELDASAAKARDRRLRRFMPSGAIVRVDLDDEHWLGAGSGDRLPALVRGRRVLIARAPVTTIARYAGLDRLHLGGLLWPEAAGRLARTAYLTREAKGRGQIILFASDPTFRGYFWASERLFLNAVLLGPGAGTAAPIPW